MNLKRNRSSQMLTPYTKENIAFVVAFVDFAFVIVIVATLMFSVTL